MGIVSAIPTSSPLNLNNLEALPIINNVTPCNSRQRPRISSSSTITTLPFGKPHESNDAQVSENNARLIVTGVQLCAFLSSQVLELYCKFGLIDDARRLFDGMSERNVFSWTSIMGLYCGLGDYEETIRLFDYGVVLGFEGNPFVNKSVLDMFVKCGMMDFARKLFEEMKFKDVVVWNMMVSGYASNGDFEQALKCFEDMKLAGVMPDRVTWNSIIAGYARKGQLEKASNCFDEMKGLDDFMPNVVSWTALIAGNEQHGHSSLALQVFRQTLIERVKPNSITIASVVSACTNLSLLQNGKEIHAYCIKTEGLDSDVFVGNALVDLYAKCRTVDVARRKFNLIKEKDLISWNSMLAGFAMGGYHEEAILLLNEMKALGFVPDIITWNGLITGFTKTGDGNKGLHFFFRMCQTGIMPNVTSISSALAGCALVKDLKLGKQIHGYVARNKIELSTGVGSALISMYSDCGRLDCKAASFLFELEPQNSGNYILLANIYSAVGRWEEAAKVRCLMKERGVSKPPGCSWIAVKRRIHSFIVGDASHPLIEEISAKVESLYSEIKEIGYVPETNFALQDVEDDEKENSLCGHSEKLAIAFGLISTPSGTPLRIIKNLRVCGDCHSATKFISKVTNREIIMRDCFRFHHFVDGVCSCGDYW
ncbi:hypothetical protein Syun_030911 [Stephania yunnanensis]|uniref:DYW domain-containing protein n=1 Tax=Stephania yunnanensis TaxID=152371 RepID=A0AAP0HCM7_9MAGN